MKNIKKLFINLMAIVMLCVCAFSLTGCVEDIKKLEITVQVYDYENHDMEEYTMDIDLYRHLAPTTVDAIASYVKDGYYDSTVFYKMEGYDSQYMIGDILHDDNVEENQGFKLNDVKPTIPGEFEYGGTTGSNLTHKKGSIGLWRSWYAVDGGYADNRNATDTGSATWFIPTSTISSYNKYFCVFGQFDTEDQDNINMLEALENAFSNEENYKEYEIYYTGEYENLTFNCVPAEDFNEDLLGDDLFVAEGAQLACYNHYTILVPTTNTGAIAARIVSAKIV